jgi:N-acetylglucosamine malate deacetylase 1
VNVVVVAPHPDDEAIGCGGAICAHVARGDRVSAVFLTSGELGLKHLATGEAWAVREREAAAAAQVLQLAQLDFLRQPDWFLGEHEASTAAGLRVVLQRERPGVIYVPHCREWHPDHQSATRVVRAALAGGAVTTPRLLGYEVWTPLAAYDHVENIAPYMRQKLKAIRCYSSQLRGFRYDRAARGLGLYRGVMCHCSYAEVFETISGEA